MYGLNSFPPGKDKTLGAPLGFPEMKLKWLDGGNSRQHISMLLGTLSVPGHCLFTHHIGCAKLQEKGRGGRG